MISSMTAFARETYRGEEGELVWELRSVNSRYLEIHPRLPDEWRGLEPKLRELLGARLGRGKVECGLRFKPAAAAGGGLRLNTDLVGQVLEAAAQVDGLLYETAPLRTMEVLNWPGAVETAEQDLSRAEARAMQTLGAAVDTLLDTRRREGARLEQAIRQRLQALRVQVGQVREKMPQVLESVRERLRERLSELAGELDAGRLEQEMALLAQRLDVDEEMDRLAAHLDEVEAVLERTEPVGRRLDFLMQELNREANTLSSKSADVEVTRTAVEMKVLIEQMREQVQNIE